MGILSEELGPVVQRLVARPRIYADANVPAGLVAHMRARLQWDVLFVLEEPDHGPERRGVSRDGRGQRPPERARRRVEHLHDPAGHADGGRPRDADHEGVSDYRHRRPEEGVRRRRRVLQRPHEPAGVVEDVDRARSLEAPDDRGRRADHDGIFRHSQRAPEIRFQLDRTFDEADRIGALLRRPDVARDIEDPEAKDE